jgi:hypothetical protein
MITGAAAFLVDFAFTAPRVLFVFAAGDDFFTGRDVAFADFSGRTFFGLAGGRGDFFFGGLGINFFIMQKL